MNKSIKQKLELTIKDSHKAFQEIPNKNRILTEIFDKLEAFDFEKYKLKAEAEIKKNLKEWWTNPDKGIKEEIALQTILFEYDGTWWTDKEAMAYGIWKWEDFELSDEGVDMGYNYEFAGEFEAMPGITLDYFNCFAVLDDDEKVKEEYDAEDYWDLDGYDELTMYAEAKGSLILHEVFVNLHAQNALSVLNIEEEFMIIFGEHDMGETSLFVITK